MKLPEKHRPERPASRFRQRVRTVLREPPRRFLTAQPACRIAPELPQHLVRRRRMPIRRTGRRGGLILSWRRRHLSSQRRRLAEHYAQPPARKYTSFTDSREECERRERRTLGAPQSLCELDVTAVSHAALLLTRLASSAIHHGFDRAGGFLGFGEVVLCDNWVAGSDSVLAWGGGGQRRQGGGGTADDPAHFLLHLQGGFFDIRRLQGAEVIGGFEAGVPGVAVHVGEGFHVRLGEEEVDRL